MAPETDRWWSRPIVVDVVAVATLAAILAILVTVASEPDSRPVDLAAYVVVGSLALTQLFRRRYPARF